MLLEVSALNTQFSVGNKVNANTVLGQGDSYLGLGGKVVTQETPLSPVLRGFSGCKGVSVTYLYEKKGTIPEHCCSLAKLVY